MKPRFEGTKYVDPRNWGTKMTDSLGPAENTTIEFKCPRCSDLVYDPKSLIENEKQRASEWEEIANKAEEKLKRFDEYRMLPVFELIDTLREELTTYRAMVKIASDALKMIVDNSNYGESFTPAAKALIDMEKVK